MTFVVNDSGFLILYANYNLKLTASNPSIISKHLVNLQLGIQTKVIILFSFFLNPIVNMQKSDTSLSLVRELNYVICLIVCIL